MYESHGVAPCTYFIRILYDLLTVMDGSLPRSLKHIISNAEYYGPSLFLLGKIFVFHLSKIHVVVHLVVYFVNLLRSFIKIKVE